MITDRMTLTTMDAWNLFHEPGATREIYRAIIQAHIQEQDQ